MLHVPGVRFLRVTLGKIRSKPSLYLASKFVFSLPFSPVTHCPPTPTPPDTVLHSFLTFSILSLPKASFKKKLDKLPHITDHILDEA